MSNIILANEYTKLPSFAKGWVSKPKPQAVAVPRKQLPDSDWDELARVREMSDAQLGQHRFPDQENLKDKTRQMGRPMHSSELVRWVLKENRNLIVEDSINCRGYAAFYAVEDGQKKPTNAHFKKGVLTEFSIIEADAADLPVRVQYGWREVLLRLVKARQLSVAQVVRMFGDTTSVQSANWRRDIQKFRR